jgi:uncharacterized protein (TIGR02001 family)
MKFTKLSLIAAVAVSAITTSAMAEVGISSNVSATNNYVWRGMTQSASKAAVQGGLDVDMNGFYAGTWGSNVDFGSPATTELDLYAGYGGEVSGIEYDVGYINFVYLNEGTANFEEVYFGLSKDFGVASLGATYSKGLANAPDDIAVDASIPVMQDYSLDLSYGDYDTYGTRYSVGASKSFGKVDFSLAYHNFDHDTTSASNEKNIVASVGTSF